MIRSRIVGTGRALPSRVLANADLEKMVDTNDQWIIERTGIRERRIVAPGQATSDLASEAAREALAMAGMTAAQLDCIIIGTVTPDTQFPSTAVYVQHQLGVSGCAAFDISAACAGFVYGLSVADAFVKAGTFKNILVVGVELLSTITDWADRNTCVLFGDGAGAVIIRAEDQSAAERPHGILSTHIHADGSGAEHLNIPGGGTRMPLSPEVIEKKLNKTKMNGKYVFQHAVRNIAQACMTALEQNKMAPADVDLVVAHQANLRIVEAVAQRVGLPMSKFHLNIQRYGNTSSASIPIALDEAVREGTVKPGMHLLMGALGGGFAWGSALVRW
jgi:3-oxoacyl-[acyl-carrier-protein] synthase III